MKLYLQALFTNRVRQIVIFFDKNFTDIHYNFLNLTVIVIAEQRGEEPVVFFPTDPTTFHCIRPRISTFKF